MRIISFLYSVRKYRAHQVVIFMILFFLAIFLITVKSIENFKCVVLRIKLLLLLLLNEVMKPL